MKLITSTLLLLSCASASEAERWRKRFYQPKKVVKWEDAEELNLPHVSSMDAANELTSFRDLAEWSIRTRTFED